MPRKRKWEFLTSQSVEALIGIIEHIAANEFAGHYSILAFTTGYKVAFGTPDLDTGHGREQVLKTPSQETLKGALVRAIMSKDSWYWNVNNLI